MSKVKIEKMLISDLDEVLKIEQENYPFPWGEKTMTDCIKAGYHCLVMKNDSLKILGYAFLMTGYKESHLLNMSIIKTSQNQGLGKKFLNYLQNVCVYSMSESFLLEVRESNFPAQHLYQNFGFKKIGLRKNYYQSAIGRENAIVMAKSLLKS